MLLRAELLSDRAVALAGPVPGSVADALASLGARTEPVPDDEHAVAELVGTRGPLHALVYDGGVAFGDGGEAALQATLEQAWIAVRAVAVGALIEAGAGGKIVLIAPRADAGPLAGAAAAALENLARTLAVEWARYGITAAAVVPAGGGETEPLVELVSFLVSRAGDYFSGCRFDLREAPA